MNVTTLADPAESSNRSNRDYAVLIVGGGAAGITVAAA